MKLKLQSAEIHSYKITKKTDCQHVREQEVFGNDGAEPAM